MIISVPADVNVRLINRRMLIMTNQGLCKNCGSLITLDDSSENCKCVFCHCVFPKEEAVKLLEDQEDLSFPNEVYEDPDQTVPAVYDEGRYDNEFSGNARILEEHEVYEPKENVGPYRRRCLVFYVPDRVRFCGRRPCRSRPG